LTILETARAEAGAAAEAAGISLRTLESLDEAVEATRVMSATWGSTQNIGHELLRALQSSGNTLIGAFSADGAMVGFVLGFWGVDEEGWHQHSHMLAALPDRRHGGVGYALKLAQRVDCLEKDVRLVRWTFDPMVVRNGWFNLGKLGAVADRFHRNFYGEMDDDLNRGERSDRLEVRWDLERPLGPRLQGAPTVAIDVEPAYDEVRAADRERAARARDSAADLLEDAFARGLVAAGFDRERSAYLMAPADEVLS
jgi:predicted GNAT superfamily acetyltransferase